MAGKTPLYLQIYGTLRRQIETGALPPGAAVGPQRALSRRFGVTLMTVRQGLARLEQDGLIRRRHGLGTFVAPGAAASPIDYDILNLQSFAGDLAARGEVVETRLVGQRFGRAPRAVADVLGGRRVLALARLRVVRGRPLSYQVTYLPESLGRAVREHDLGLHSLRHVLEHKLGVGIVRAAETVSAVRLRPRPARVLGRPPGSPAFRADRVSFGARDEALLVDRVWIPGGRFRITRELRYGSLQEVP